MDANLFVSLLSFFSLMFTGVQTNVTIPNPSIQEISLSNSDAIAIQNFSEAGTLQKQYKVIESNGNSIGQLDEMLKSYLADGDTYLLSDTHEIYAFSDKDINGEKSMGEKIYSQVELESMAKTLLAKGTDVKVENLTPNYGNKGDNYFFRWEDTSKKIFDGNFNAFVQVGIRKDGWLFSYTYALPY